ncbi:MAG TPA: MEDS domain-containing protein [Opitutaceae bacterium]|nr:MEDS domain-containing protein [Opitutaceae bacterium]
MCQHHVTIGNQKLKGVRHICCFYDSSQQLESVFLPYLQEGIRNGEHVVCIFPEGEHANLKAKLKAGGSELEAAESREQFKVLTEDETYIAGGSFAKTRMAGMLKDVLEAAKNGPHPTVRTLGEMSWALRNLPGTDELAEYECMVNELCDTYGCTLACAYDLNKFSGRVLADAFATHSHIVLNGVIHENVHYMPPAEFLGHVARRRSGPGKLSAEEN